MGDVGLENTGVYATSASETVERPVRLCRTALVNKLCKRARFGLQAMNDVVDIILVGDSVGMVVLGHDSTVPVTLDAMVHHSAAVARGASRPLLVADLPFGSYATVDKAVASAVRLVQEGCVHSVKLEGGLSQANKIRGICDEGIPVMGHIGLLPQTAPLASGYSLQGRSATAAMRAVEDALAVQDAGAYSMVLEMLPVQVSAFISGILQIPTIGIGAGPSCGGQVLVSHDMLGMYPRLSPKFVRKYADIGTTMRSAFTSYADDVHKKRFPGSGVTANDAFLASSDASSSTSQAVRASPTPVHHASSKQQHYYDMSVADCAEFIRLVRHYYPGEHKAISALELAAAELEQRSGQSLPILPSSSAPVSDKAATDNGAVRQSSSRPSARTANAGASTTASHPSAPSASLASSSSSILHHQQHERPLNVAILGSGSIASLLATGLASAPSPSVPPTITMFSNWGGRLSDIKRNGIRWRRNIGEDGGTGEVEVAHVNETVHVGSTPFEALVRGLLVNDDDTPAPLPQNDSIGVAGYELLSRHIGAYDVVFLCGKAHQVDGQGHLAALLVRPHATAEAHGNSAAPVMASPSSSSTIASSDCSKVAADAPVGACGGIIVPMYNGGFTHDYLNVLTKLLPDRWGLDASASAAAAAADDDADAHQPLLGDVAVDALVRKQLQGLKPWQVAYGQTSFGARAVAVADAAALSSSIRSSLAQRTGSGSSGGSTACQTIIEHTGEGITHVCMPDKAAPRAASDILASLFSTASASSAASTASFAQSSSSAAASRLLQVKIGQPSDYLNLCWSKLAINSVLNPVVTMMGTQNGGFLNACKGGPSKHLIERLCGEAADAGRLEAGTAGFDLTGSELLDRCKAVASATASNTNSMLADAQNNRLSELDYISGPVIYALGGDLAYMAKSDPHSGWSLPQAGSKQAGSSATDSDSNGEDAADVPRCKAHKHVYHTIERREVSMGVRTRDDDTRFERMWDIIEDSELTCSI